MVEIVERNSSKDNIIKVVLLGESGVGKTSIIQRFILDKFESYAIPTYGASSCLKSYKIDEEEIIFDIWDTAGQERYRGLARQFYNNAQIGILVYDITDPNSFKELKSYWYKEIVDNSKKDISILILYNIMI